MAPPRIRLYVAASLDGFIAAKDGGVAWLDPFGGEYGYDAFFASIHTLVMGRATYDQARDLGPWPYEGRPTWVLTSRAMRRMPQGVEPWPWGVPKLVEQLRAGDGDVWLVGGGRTLRGFLEADAVDDIELFVMPRLLGDGIRLFEPTPAFSALKLVDTHAWNDGVVRLRYARVREVGG